MKSLLLPLVLWCTVGLLCRADEPPKLATGKDIVDDIKLVVRSDNGEKLTDEEKWRVSMMVSYIKGFTDGMRPMQVLFPQGPVQIPDSVTIGQFAKILDRYITDNPDSKNDPTSLVLFNCAFAAYQNPSFNPALMPQRIPMPDLKGLPEKKK